MGLKHLRVEQLSGRFAEPNRLQMKKMVNHMRLKISHPDQNWKSLWISITLVTYILENLMILLSVFGAAHSIPKWNLSCPSKSIRQDWNDDQCWLMVAACIIGRVEILQGNRCCGYTVLVVTLCGRGLETSMILPTHTISLLPDLLWFGESQGGMTLDAQASAVQQVLRRKGSIKHT